MAGQSKVRFKLEDLKSKALDAIDAQIEQAGRDLEYLLDDDALQRDRDQWRNDVIEKVAGLYNDLQGDLEDRDLKFRLTSFPTYPVRDEYTVLRAQKRLKLLEEQRNKVVAKAESLVPDADGNISLTKTALADYFGL